MLSEQAREKQDDAGEADQRRAEGAGKAPV